MDKQKLEDLKVRAKRQFQLHAPEITLGVTLAILAGLAFYTKKTWPESPSKEDFEQAKKSLELMRNSLEECSKTPTLHLSGSDRDRLREGAAIIFEFGDKDRFCLMTCNEEHS